MENNGLNEALNGNLKFNPRTRPKSVENDLANAQPLLIDPFIENFKKRKKLHQEEEEKKQEEEEEVSSQPEKCNWVVVEDPHQK